MTHLPVEFVEWPSLSRRWCSKRINLLRRSISDRLFRQGTSWGSEEEEEESGELVKFFLPSAHLDGWFVRTLNRCPTATQNEHVTYFKSCATFKHGAILSLVC